MSNRPRLNWITVLIAALVLSMIWTYVSIQSKPVVEAPKEATLSVFQDYRITTGKALIAWPSGSVLEPGMAAYFYAADPKLQVIPAITLSGLEQGFLNGLIETDGILQAIDDKSRVYWSYPFTGKVRQAFTLSGNEAGQFGQTLSITGLDPVDISSINELVTQINDELKFYNGLFQLVIRVQIHLSGTINGVPVEKNIVQTLPFTLQQVSFSAPNPQELSSEVSLTRGNNPLPQITWMDRLWDNPIPFLLTFILGLSLVFLLMKKSAAKSKTDREHRRFREWITEGIVDVGGKVMINILSLEGLVDLAIDLDKRVIFDSKVGKYYVLTEDLVYGYDPARSHFVPENRQQLGKLLIERGLIQPEQLEIGLYYQKKIGRRLGDSLTALGFIDETTLYSILAAQQNTDYYELDAAGVPADTSWLDKLNLQRARAMTVLPLGKRADGKLVTACSDISREGIQQALEEILGEEIYMVAARPSALYQALDRLEAQLKEKDRLSEKTGENKETVSTLSGREKDQFISSYIRGSLVHELLLRAAGAADQETIRQVPEQEDLLAWLVNRNSISADLANLIKGLEKAVEAMDWKSRQQKKFPGLVDLLTKANYLTSRSTDWINRELALQAVPLEILLQRNFLVSGETLKNAVMLTHALESILSKASTLSEYD
jgi:hypothetical protein